MDTEEHFEAGYHAGLAAWRRSGGHAVPAEHPPGSTKAGSAWFRGCLAGLEHAECLAKLEPEGLPS